MGEEVMIDNRIHSIIIGRKGTGIRKIQQEYGVEIKLPREGDPNPDMVIIMGGEEGVLDCKDHLLNIQEEYLQDAIDQKCFKNMRNLLAEVQKNHSPRILTQMALKSSKEPHGKEQVTKQLFQHWAEEAMHRQFLPLPL